MICIAFQQNYLPFLIINNGLGLILCTTVNCVRQVSRFFLIPIIYNSIHCCYNRPKCAIIFVIWSIQSLILWIECLNIGLIIPAKWLKTEWLKMFLCKSMFEGMMPDILLIRVWEKYVHIPPSLNIPNHIKSIIKLSVSRFSKQFQGNKIFIAVIEL